MGNNARLGKSNNDCSGATIMDTTPQSEISRKRVPQVAICNRCSRRLAFTLVELLIVITIIGILASLITAAGIAAMNTGRRTRIKTEINQLDMAIQTYKENSGSYPPNCQIDGTTGSDAPLLETQVQTDLKRHLKQAFPRHDESDELIGKLAGLLPNGNLLPTGSGGLQGGMSAGEAIVFWLSGFSSDPKYPISGEGGLSYLASDLNRDPIENRKWVFPFYVARF